MAIRRAWRHFSFFCVSAQFVMLYVSVLSSASVALLFMCSIQSSNSSSWLDVLSVSFSNKILLPSSHSSFVLFSFLDSLVAHFVILNVFSSKSLSERFCLVYMFVFDLVSMMRRSIHSGLCCTDHFSCSFVVVHVPAPYMIVDVTTASKRCNPCRSR